MSTIHDRIYRARQAAGLSQTELANRAGVSQPTVAGWESATFPRQSALPDLARALDVDLVWLLNGDAGLRAALPPYFALPIRHVPVFDWPPAGEAVDHSRPRGFVPVASNQDGLFALTSDTDRTEAAAGTVLVFGDPSPTGRHLTAEGTISGEPGDHIARHIMTITTH